MSTLKCGGGGGCNFCEICVGLKVRGQSVYKRIFVNEKEERITFTNDTFPSFKIL